MGKERNRAQFFTKYNVRTNIKGGPAKMQMAKFLSYSAANLQNSCPYPHDKAKVWPDVIFTWPRLNIVLAQVPSSPSMFIVD